MSILDEIKRGTGDLPHRFLLAGPEGIGKTTFASQAPNPVYIAAEDGLTGFSHISRYTPKGLTDLYALLTGLTQTSKHPHKTVVIDTADWLERFLAAGICERDGKANIEEYGYGKGWVLLENELVKVLGKLDVLREKGMGVIILSHVQIRTFNSPEGESWDRYEMKGNKKFCGILREWPDACLFATFQVFKTKLKGNPNKEKAIGGERVIHTQWSPAWDAKNRFNLPDPISLDWAVLQQAIEDNSPDALRKRVRALYQTAQLPEENKAKLERWMTTLDSEPPAKLQAAIERLTELQPK